MHEASNSDSLFQRFRDGDPDAFDELVAPLLGPLERRAAQRMDERLRKKLSAADLVQEAQMVAARRRAEFVGESHEELRRWLAGILKHRLQKAAARFHGTERRHLERELTGGQRIEPDALPGAGGTPSVDVARAELHERLRVARAELSEDERELLQLVHEEGYKLREAAEILGIAYDATRKRHARAIIRLGQAFRRITGEGDGP